MRICYKKMRLLKVFAYNYLENYEKQVRFMTILKELIAEREWEYLNEDAGEREEDTETNETEVIEENKTGTWISTHEEPEIDIYAGMEHTSYQTSKKRL